MNAATIAEDLIDASVGIGEHRKLLTLCVADYLIARHIAEADEYAKEITFVYENRDRYPDMWQDYSLRYQITEDIEYASIHRLIASDKKRQADMTEKYLRDYYVLRDKYGITSTLENDFPEMSRSECPIYPADYIELNKEYAYLKNNDLPCSDSYLDLMIFGEKKLIIDILSAEIKKAKAFLSDPTEDKDFINLNIRLLSDKIKTFTA